MEGIDMDWCRKIVPDANLDVLVELTASQVVGEVEQGVTFLPAMLNVVGVQGSDQEPKVTGPMEIPIDEHRYAVMRTIGGSLVLNGVLPVAVVMTNETWSVVMDLDEFKAVKQGGKKYVAPRDNPEHVEGVAVIGMTLDGRVSCITYKTERVDKNQMRLVTPQSALRREQLAKNAAYTPKSDLLDAFMAGVRRAVQMVAQMAPKPGNGPEVLQ